MQQKSYYWSKYCFKEVRFKASVEGTEGMAVTESERKRIPDLCCREAKGTTTMLFLFVCCLFLKKGMRKILSSEEEHRDLEGTEIWTRSAKY